jgi:hypothetical protein
MKGKLPNLGSAAAKAMMDQYDKELKEFRKQVEGGELKALVGLSAGIGRSLTGMFPPPLGVSLTDAVGKLDSFLVREHFVGPKIGFYLSDDQFRSGIVFRDLDRQIRPYLDASAKQLEGQHAAYQETFHQMERVWQAWEEADRILNEKAPHLAEFGWTLPMQMDTRMMLEVLSEKDRERVDACFVEFYASEDGEAFATLKVDVLNSDHFRRWKPLLEECFDAYERGRFLICVPSLLSILEGCIAVGGIQISKRKEQFPAKIKECPPGSIESAMWKSIDVFFDLLFHNVDFKGTPPDIINRNWILHGHDVPSWGQSDALRLFHALDTITSALAVTRTRPIPVEA